MKKSVYGFLSAPLFLFAGCFLNMTAVAGEPIEGGFSSLTVIDAGELGDLRGGDGNTSTIVRSEQNVQATVNGSTIRADAIASGGISIGEQHLDGGISMISAVSGLNNSINNTMSINFNLQ